MPKPVLNHPDHRDVTLQSIDDYGRQLMKAIEGLGIEEARWMPTPESNHILYLQFCPPEENSPWENSPKEILPGDSIEQVRTFPNFTVEEVTDYWQAARDLLIPSVEQVSTRMLDIKRPEIWTHAPDRAPTLLWVLGRLPVENGQHTGHIAYIRGLYNSKLS